VEQELMGDISRLLPESSLTMTPSELSQKISWDLPPPSHPVTRGLLEPTDPNGD